MYVVSLPKDNADRIYDAKLNGFGTFLERNLYEGLKVGDTVELGVVSKEKHPLRGKLMKVEKLKEWNDVYIVEMEFKGGMDYENN